MHPLQFGSILLLGVSLGWASRARCQELPASNQWIANFDGDPSSFVVRRPNQKRPQFAALMYVYPGDVIELKDDSSWIEVHIGATQGDVVVCKSEKAGRPCDERPPYTVPNVPAEPTKAQRFVSWFGRQISGWIYGTHPVLPKQARPVRTGEISMPLLEAESVRIAEGSRKLCLSWSGGTEPYRIRIILIETRTRILDANPAEGARWCSNEIDWKQGVYWLELTAGEATFHNGFFVVGQSEVPHLPPESLEGLSPNLQKTLEAAWLSSRGQGKWLWEAYIRIVPLCDTYRPAHDLCAALEAGQPPINPPAVTEEIQTKP